MRQQKYIIQNISHTSYSSFGKETNFWIVQNAEFINKVTLIITLPVLPKDCPFNIIRSIILSIGGRHVQYLDSDYLSATNHPIKKSDGKIYIELPFDFGRHGLPLYALDYHEVHILVRYNCLDVCCFDLKTYEMSNFVSELLCEYKHIFARPINKNIVVQYKYIHTFTEFISTIKKHERDDTMALTKKYLTRKLYKVLAVYICSFLIHTPEKVIKVMQLRYETKNVEGIIVTIKDYNSQNNNSTVYHPCVESAKIIFDKNDKGYSVRPLYKHITNFDTNVCYIPFLNNRSFWYDIYFTLLLPKPKYRLFEMNVHAICYSKMHINNGVCYISNC